MTTNSIAPYAESPLEERHRYAQALASAGDLIPRALFGPPENGKPPQPSVGKVLLVLETGAMLGLHPIAALSGINVIEGKPAASAGLMSAIVRNAGHKLRVTESGSIEGGDYAATATLIRADDPDNPFTSTWTPQRAARAGLCRYVEEGGVWTVVARSSGGKPLPWESYTESLCKARAVSEIARDGGQDALVGVRYTPEELGGVVDATGDYTGEMLEAEAVDAPEPSAMPAARKRATNGTQGRKRATPTPAEDKTNAPAEEMGAALNEVTVEPEPDEPAAEEQATYSSADSKGSREHDADTGAVIEGTEKPARDFHAAKSPDALEGESEPEYQHRKQAERKAEEVKARVAQAKIDGAATRAKREAEEAAAAAEPFELAAPDVAEEEERLERARIAAEQEEIARKTEAEATVERIRSERIAAGKPVGPAVEERPMIAGGDVSENPTAYELATQEEPDNWLRRVAAAQLVGEAKAVWDEATAAQQMTTELRMAIIKRKAKLEAPVDDAPSDEE